MTFNPEEFLSLIAIVWEATLGLPIEADAPPLNSNRTRNVAACIQITGGWEGAILLDCPNEMAARAASIMFDTPPGDVTIPDLQDAIAELVNMIGGNFKALLPETCFLSLPAVVEGGDYSARIPGSQVFGKISFGCDGEAINVVIFQKIASKAAA